MNGASRVAEFADAAKRMVRLVQSGTRAEVVERVPICALVPGKATRGANPPRNQLTRHRDNTRSARLSTCSRPSVG